MSELGKLIQELCPNGVMFMPLNAVCKVQNKGTITKDDLVDEGYPVINSSREVLGYYWDFNNEPDTLVLTSHGAYAGFSHYLNERFYAGALCYPIKTSDETVIGTKYLYYVFKSLESTIREKYVNKSGVPYINFKALMSHKIAVPPIAVQTEIVKILDNFTNLTATLTTELTSELTARKTQYEYYRDELLSLPDVPRMPLSQLTLKVGSINWKNTDGARKYIDLSSVDRDTHSIIDADVLEVSADNAPSRAKQLVKENDILFGGTRPMLKRYCIVPVEYDEQVCSTGYCVLRVDNKIAFTNYVYHCLGTSEFYRYVEANQQGASYPAIGDKVLKDYEIPVPSLEMQEKIATVLDRFNALCNDISTGLPAEIEARQKQYEYYRDKLLTFKEKSL